MEAIRFVDTTLRDGAMSLWATNLTTPALLPVVPCLAQAGFEAMEIITTTHVRKMVRDLKEDPWERIREVARRAPDTPLRLIRGRHVLDFDISPRSIARLLMERMKANGIRQVRMSDPSNTVANWADLVREARAVGMDPIINVIYSLSPRHTDQYYAERVRELARLNVFRICFKDPGALLTPERTRTLVPVFLEHAGDVPVEFHTHCITGLGPHCCIEALKQGIRIVNTAVPPLANGSSNPSVFNVARNARVLGFAPNVNEALLQPVVEHFTRVAKRDGLPIGVPQEPDESHYLHQVPGGMISNLRFQLAQVGMEDKLAGVLEETIRVRAELGYPIMVTPYSQFVGVQAALNLMLGERYKEVTDQVIHYALGHWGEEESAAVDPNVRDRILARPRARELAAWEPAQPSLRDLREKFGGAGVSDDELVLRYYTSPEEVAALRATKPGPIVDRRLPLPALVGELAKNTRLRLVQIQKGPLLVRLESRSTAVRAD